MTSHSNLSLWSHTHSSSLVLPPTRSIPTRVSNKYKHYTLHQHTPSSLRVLHCLQPSPLHALVANQKDPEGSRRNQKEPHRIAQLLPSSLPLSPNRSTRSQHSLPLSLNTSTRPPLRRHAGALPSRLHHTPRPQLSSGHGIYAHLLWISTHRHLIAISQTSHRHSQPSHSHLTDTHSHLTDTHSHLIAIS